MALGASLNDAGGFLKTTAGGAGFETNKESFPGLVEIIGIIIEYVLSFVGVLFLILTIYGGYLYMTAGGNEDQVKKAKKFITNALIGLVITLSAYALTSFIVGQAITAVTQ